MPVSFRPRFFTNVFGFGALISSIVFAGCHGTRVKVPDASSANSAAPRSTASAANTQSAPMTAASTSTPLQYSEFKKVLTPKSEILTLPGGEESLLLLRMPKDEYAKVYKMNHATKEFSLQYDAGQNIAFLQRDPKHKRYFIGVDKLGDENFRIYTYDVDSKRAKMIFGNDGFRASIASFPKNVDVAYIQSNHEDKKTYSIYRLDLNSGKFERVTDGKENWDSAEVTPDEKFLLLTRSLGNNESHLYKMDLQTRKPELVFKKKNTIYQVEFLDPVKPIAYLTSDENRDRTGCASWDFSKKKNQLTWIRSENNKDISCNFDSFSNVTKVIEHFDGRSRFRLLKGVFGAEIKTPIPDKTAAYSFYNAPGTDTALVYLSSAKSSGELFKFKLSEGKNGKLEVVSKFNLSGLDANQFGDSFDFRYTSFDGREIHGLIFAKKEWMTDGSKHPLIVWPHGGPDSAINHEYNTYFQYWIQSGYIVFAPNFRGSLGYGKKFETLNDRDWGGGHIKDVIWGKRAMAKKSFVDSDRIFIVGRSFGGFSTLSAITQYPKEFRAAVAIVAIGNLFTFMKSIPPDPAWQTEFLSEVGDPVKDKALYMDRSPHFHASKVAIPLKIYQSENDVRTVKAEMDNFVAELRKHSIPVEYEVLEKEGHAPTRDETWQKLLQGTVEFLNQNSAAQTLSDNS